MEKKPLIRFNKNSNENDLYNAIESLVRWWARKKVLAPIRRGGKSRAKYYPKIEKEVSFDGRYMKFVIDLSGIAEFIENGRRAGKMPPLKEIGKWIKRKNIIPHGNTTIPQLTFLIARSIGKNGTKPKYYLKDQIAKTQFNLHDEIEKAINKFYKAKLK